jgi:TPR repeat protein
MGVFAFVTAAALIGSPPTTIPSIIVNPSPRPRAFDGDLRKTNELGCHDGEQSFCYALAGMLRFGVGGPADPKRAERLLETACRKGYSIACSKVEH